MMVDLTKAAFSYLTRCAMRLVPGKKKERHM
jgi:hypothetical protein